MTILLILLLLFLAALFYLRWQWLRNPTGVINFFMRRMMSRQQREQQNAYERRQNERRRYERKSNYRSTGKESIIPQEYAEDVAFEEVKSFGSDEDILPQEKSTERSATYERGRDEGQVSDAEWEDIK
jgi:hypothetical protein